MIIFAIEKLKRKGESVMKLAFLISVQKDARHLRDLVDSLPKDSEFYIHVDKRRDVEHFQKDLIKDNIHFLSERIGAIANSLNEVEIQVSLIREALKGDADYFVMLDGLDYPLWSNDRINEFFTDANGKQMLKGIAMLGQGKEAYKYTDFQLFNDHHLSGGSFKSRARSLARRVLSGGHVHKTLRIHCPEKTYTLYKGSSSWAITPELGKLIVKEWDENKHLKTYFSTSYRPVETFIPTVALNSEFASQCMLVKGHYNNFTSLMPLTYIGRNHTPKILTEDDYNALHESKKMFARQIVSGYSDGLKSLIDAGRRNGGVTVKEAI